MTGPGRCAQCGNFLEDPDWLHDPVKGECVNVPAREILTFPGITVGKVSSGKRPLPGRIPACSHPHGFDTFCRDGNDPHYACGICGRREDGPVAAAPEHRVPCANPRCTMEFPLKGWFPEHGTAGFCGKCLASVRKVGMIRKHIENERAKSPDGMTSWDRVEKYRLEHGHLPPQDGKPLAGCIVCCPPKATA